MAHIKIYTLFILLLSLTFSISVEQAVERGVLQIQPSALESLRNHFSDLVVLLYDGSNSNATNPYEQEFIEVTKTLKEVYPRPSRLFGMIDTRDDVNKVLRPMSLSVPSIQIFTKLRNYEFPLGRQSIEGLIPFYADSVLPTLQVKKDISNIPNNTLIFGFSNETEYKAHQKTYLDLHEQLDTFSVGAIAVEASSPYIKLKSGESPDDWIPYVNEFDNKQDILDFVNVQTLPLLTELSDSNYQRIFGSQIDKQFLIIYNESIKPQELKRYSEILTTVARHNKYQELKYERLLFASVNMEFAENLFGDLLEDLTDSDIKLLITHTDYNNFQLERYLYNKPEINEQSIKAFIEDFRMKRIDPHYRSEIRPDNTGKHILKIVGKTFSEAIYKSRQSVLVLFYDSKDPSSYVEWNNTLVTFEQKYRDLLAGKLIVGRFDLALNEHETLHLQYAPQLILFEKTNKKKAKSYRGEMSVNAVTDWINYWIKDMNIPDNYGEKPLELGGRTDVSTTVTENAEL